MRKASSLIAVALVAGATLVVPAPPTFAACATNPGTNPITIDPGPPLDDPIRPVPGAPGGLVGICVDVAGDPAPQVGTNVTITPGSQCGIPCFVVAYDGVSTNSLTVTVTITVRGETASFPFTVPGGAYGSFCINAGMPCP